MSRPSAPDPGLLDAFLARTALDRHLLSREVYGGATLAVEFHYRDLRFAFDVTPLEDGRTELVLVDRAHETGFAMLEDAPDGRETLGVHDEDWVVQEHLHNRAVRMMSQIDARLDRAAPAAAPAPAVAGQGGLTVGIMTLPLNANYGGNLQTFALMHVLRAMGHAPLLINVRHPWGKDADVDSSRPPMAESIDLDPEIANGAFIDRYLQPMTRSFTKPGDLAAQVGPLGLGAVVAGSDQIWRARYARTLLLPFYYCGFLSEGSPVRRVSYAASFGQPDWQYDEGQTRRAAQLIRRLDGASVREDNAVELCRDNLGVEPAHVLDPTLLLDPEAYDPVLAEAPVARPPGGLLTYILDVTPDKAQAIATLSEALSKPATRPDGAGFGAEGAGPDPSVEGWLAAFRAADFVVTDSFHGVAFAILFGKPFLAYGNPGRGMARFTSMLKTVGLEDRLIRASSEINVDRMRQPIDWDVVGDRLGAMRRRSLDFLEGALAGDPRVRPVPADRASAAPSTTAGPAPLVPSPALAASEGAPFGIPVAEARVEIENLLGTLCTGCGACVSESRGALRMEWDRDGFLVPRATGRDLPSETVRVCPFNPAPEAAVRDEDVLGAAFLPDAPRSHPEGGRFERTYAGYSVAHRAAGSSGGIATWVFERLLARGDVDYLFVVRGDGDRGYRYAVFDGTADITEISRTRYFPVTMEELFSLVTLAQGRVAVSGVACFVKALRLKQHYHPELRDKIPFVLGIICGGLKSRHYTDFLAQAAGARGPYSAPQYRLKNPERFANDYSFSAEDAEARTHRVDMKTLGDMWGTGLFKARACDFCTDVLTELADISVGDAWLPEYKTDGMGHSVVVTRSPLAEKIIREGIASGALVMKDEPVERILRSQLAGLHHKQHAVKFRAWLGRTVLGVPVPYLRPRLMRDVTAGEALVQILRERTRARSLKVWRETRDAAVFRRRMRQTLQRLNHITHARTRGAIDPVRYRQAVRSFVAGEDGWAWLRRYPMGRWLTRRLRDPAFGVDEMRALDATCSREQTR